MVCTESALCLDYWFCSSIYCFDCCLFLVTTFAW